MASMKRIVFGVFAHPDDEAFGPSATLMQEVAQGAELHLICLTAGEKGINADKYENLGEVRLKEWQAAGDAIGATTLYALGYADGSLCNNLYHDVVAKIESVVLKVCKSHQEPLEICFVTFDTNGLTGHLDHVAASYMATHVFYQLKAHPPAGATIHEIAYFCFSQHQLPAPRLDYFVYMPAGYPDNYITRKVDVSKLLPRKYKIMHLHKTQRADAETFLAYGEAFHATDNFHVLE